MEIQINERYRIKSDSQNIILQEYKHIVSSKEGVEPRNEWRDIAYYYKLEQACMGLIDRMAKDSDATSIQELLLVIRNLGKQIKSAVSN